MNLIIEHQRRGGRGIIALGVATAMLLVTGAMAAETITSKVDVTPATNQFDGAEWRSISLSASRVLMHVDAALQALADKKNDSASANVGKGLMLVKILDGVLPATQVKTVITGAGTTYQDEDKVKASFVPIYREYDSVDVISPVTAQKQTKATGKASAKLPAVTLEAVSYAGVEYSDVKLDLRLARRELLAAQDSLKAGDATAAKFALQDIQSNGVIFEYSSERLPLARAMDNLRLAESELKNNHPEQAKAALASATDALKKYEAIGGDSHAKDVQDVEKQIDETAKNIAQHNQESFSKKISEWWNKCLEWARTV